ncbi:MAG TPA: hypothetical protein PLK69_10535 [Tetrasphaera sp.]|nr:hypothetical protein [Tetrasphaera sp.]
MTRPRTRRLRGSAIAVALATLLAGPAYAVRPPAVAGSPHTLGGAGAAAGAPAPGFVTFAWGRTLWAHGCNPGTPVQPGVRTLEQTAQDLAAYGLRGVGGVVIDRTTATRVCARGVTTTSWADLTRLATRYGWSYVSQSMTYTRMTTLTTNAQRYRESGATLPILAGRGHTKAWGAFFYPDDEQDLAAQRVVSRYFAFGRLYVLEATPNIKAAATRFPYPVLTYTPLGGRCADESLPCHDIVVRNDRITHSPDEIAQALNPPAGQWSVIQMFRLVEGKSGTLGQANAWDCTSPDWRARWTGIPENYCRNSLLDALARRDPTARNVTFAEMATRWGRTPSG